MYIVLQRLVLSVHHRVSIKEQSSSARRTYSVSRKGTGSAEKSKNQCRNLDGETEWDVQNRNPSKRRLQRLIQDITHFVLDFPPMLISTQEPGTWHALTVLRRHQRIEQIPPVQTLQRDNLPARAAAIRLEVECLPEMVNRCGRWVRADVEEDANAVGGS